jgi:enoyl-CoA hydratase
VGTTCASLLAIGSLQATAGAVEASTLGDDLWLVSDVARVPPQLVTTSNSTTKSLNTAWSVTEPGAGSCRECEARLSRVHPLPNPPPEGGGGLHRPREVVRGDAHPLVEVQPVRVGAVRTDPGIEVELIAVEALGLVDHPVHQLARVPLASMLESRAQVIAIQRVAPREVMDGAEASDGDCIKISLDENAHQTVTLRPQDLVHVRGEHGLGPDVRPELDHRFVREVRSSGVNLLDHPLMWCPSSERRRPICRMIAVMGYEHILVEIEPPIATITLNRPKVLNALTPDLIREVNTALRELDSDDKVGAVVLTGGPRVFAAGADIGDMAEQSAVDQLRRDQTGRWVGITGFTKPLIAAVNGYALGGGCELTLMCDMVIAGDSARFGQPEINLGVIPGAGGTQRWPRTAGKYAAMEAVLSGAPVTARRAYELGLVNKVVPAEMTISVAKRTARELAGKAPLALRMAKEAVLKAFESPLSEGLAAERKSFYFLFTTEDQKEGMRAFLEKRRPSFKGR